MIRSPVNTVRGRATTSVPRILAADDPPFLPAAFSTLTNEPASAIDPHAPARKPTSRPERCCVYCGHEMYAPPRVERVRCPKCFTEIMVKDVRIEGDVTADEPIVTAGKIFVGESARVAADLVACSVEISGRVLGNVLASQICTVRSTGKIAGHILCRHLSLQPGASVEGPIEVVQS